ncbi:hypothetical protein [Gimesia sp.]|uniref:hypothetical protein n=1 Tax=Gimesia sp. TaxID=2024833 RepID=UPI003A8EEFA6
MKPVTPKDVIRLFEGGVSDLEEMYRIIRAIDEDKKLQLIERMWNDSELDEKEGQPELPPLDFPDLFHTRLCRLKPESDLTGLLELERIEVKVEYEVNGVIKSFQLILTRTGENQFKLEADWPSHLAPMSFVLAGFDLDRGRKPFEAEIELPQKPVVRPAAEPENAPGSAVYGHTGALMADAGNLDQEGNEEPNGDTRYFSVSRDSDDDRKLNLEEGDLEVYAKIGKRTDDLVVVEVFDAPDTESPSACSVVPVHRNEHESIAKGRLQNFPLYDAPSKKGKIRVRALEEGDIPCLSNEQVTTLLAEECENFAAVPVTAQEPDVFTTEFRYEFQKSRLSDEKTAWFLQMAEQGGEV